MASATLSLANAALQANGKGFSDFSGLRNSSTSLPFSRKASSDDFVSVIAFQTSSVGGNGGYRKGVVEAKIKVAINGFGRIGRNFLRCWHGRKDSPLDVIAINDTGGVKQASHLLKYDSTLGIFDADVKPASDTSISVDGKVIRVVSNRNPANLPWKEMGVDLVIEGTGVFVDREGAGKHIEAGAKKVLITAPGKGDIPTYVVGVNAENYSPDEPIISNASCTTNCLAPFVKVLDLKFEMAGSLVNARCYIAPVVETTEELKKEMSSSHWQILRRTPFAHLMDLPPLVQERGVLDALLRMYDDRIQRFNFGDTALEFRPEDVALVMGVRCVGDTVSFAHEGPSSDFERAFLNKTHNRHRDAIKDNLLRLVHGETGTEENFVKLLIVYLMTTVLFPNTSLNAPSFVARYADNLETIGNFAWAHAIHRWLMSDLPNTANRVQLRCQGKSSIVGYLKGCTVALLVWFYEVTGGVKKHRVGRFPRIMCYGDSPCIKGRSIEKLLASLEGKEFTGLLPANDDEISLVGRGSASVRSTNPRSSQLGDSRKRSRSPSSLKTEVRRKERRRTSGNRAVDDDVNPGVHYPGQSADTAERADAPVQGDEDVRTLLQRLVDDVGRLQARMDERDARDAERERRAEATPPVVHSVPRSSASYKRLARRSTQQLTVHMPSDETTTAVAEEEPTEQIKSPVADEEPAMKGEPSPAKGEPSGPPADDKFPAIQWEATLSTRQPTKATEVTTQAIVAAKGNWGWLPISVGSTTTGRRSTRHPAKKAEIPEPPSKKALL